MKYNTFLSYNSKNTNEAQELYDFLVNAGLKVFYDKKEISIGDDFQKKLEDGIKTSDSVIILIGENGIGPWQNSEITAFNYIKHNSLKIKIFPVYLNNANPDHSDIPLFIKVLSHIKWNSNPKEEELETTFELIEEIHKNSNKYFIGSEIERPILAYEYDNLVRGTIGAYNEISESYYERWKSDLPGSINDFLRLLKKGSKILDAGCGPGHHSNFMGKEGYEVTGIELARDAFNIANKNKISSKVNFEIADMRSYFNNSKHKRNSLDGIWASASCIHTPKENLSNQLDQFFAGLKPSGILGISFQLGSISLVDSSNRFFERYKSEKIVTKKLNKAGFQIISTNKKYSTGSTTNNNKKVKAWLHIIAKAPEKKDKILITI